MTADSVSKEPNTTIKEHEETISPAKVTGRDYFDCAIAWIRKSEWDKARSALISANEQGFDVPAAFIDAYESAGEFEDAFDLELPGDIADIVDPISEEEDAALARLTEEGLKSELVSRETIMAILRGEDGA